jgi:Kyanoviridae peptidase
VTSQVNVEAKNHLARLLATENIWIQHRNVLTASFDTVSRILTFPIWKAMSDSLYTMLAAHEVGHALWTQREKLSTLAKLIDPANTRIAGAYLNIVEDARIERLIKLRYPGLRFPFAQAYQELFEADKFGIKEANVETLPLVDRINLHFKIGHHVTVRFTVDEQALVKKVVSTVTFQDVVAVTKEIYEFAKQDAAQPTPVDLDESGSEDDASAAPGDGDGDGEAGAADGPGEGDDPADQADCDQDGNTKKQSTKPKSSAPEEPITQKSLDDSFEKFNDLKAPNTVYVALPTPNLSKIIVDYPTVHKHIRQYAVNKRSKITLPEAEKAFAEFKADNQSKINYIHQQFELKQQADQNHRTKIHRTGSIDTLRLHAYRYDDNLFKTLEVVTDGKNHGLLFVVDWSGSMQHSMAGTLEQLVVLCLFCRKARIPFEVYSLTVGGNDAFSTNPGELCYASNFRMRTYLSSRMTGPEFNDACVNLFLLMPNGQYVGGPADDKLVDCTPLDEAIVTTIDLMHEFRRRTKTQIVNAIFLTDGGANTVSEYHDSSGRKASMRPGERYMLDDRPAHKVYEFTRSDMTPTMLTLLRDRQNINVIGFYIQGRWQGFFSTTDKNVLAALDKQFKEDGYVVSTEWGYSELYITSGGKLKIKAVNMTPAASTAKGTPEYAKALVSLFTKQGQAISKQRFMLDRFVKLIA